MQLSDLRAEALGRYGLDDSGAADARFTVSVLNRILNEKHRWLAKQCLCYRQTAAVNLALGSGGLTTAALPWNVIDIVPGTVRALYGGTWVRLDYVPEEQLLAEYAPLENQTPGAPLWYFLRDGDSLTSQLELCAYPGSDQAVTDGLKVDAWIYPVQMADDSDTPALQPAEHVNLVLACCWGMAELERSLGRADDALVAMWRGRALDGMLVLKGTLEAARRPDVRRVRYTDYGPGYGVGGW